MQIVNQSLLKQISLGKDPVTVATNGGGEWTLSPELAAQILDTVTTLPEGRKVELKMLSDNRNIFERIYQDSVKVLKSRATATKPEKHKDEQ